MRIYAEGLSTKARRLVDSLPGAKDVLQYRVAMTELGGELAREVVPRLPSRDGIVLICSNEDADFIARGLLEGLNAEGYRVSLVCFWNDRVHLGWGEDRSPIVKRYVEPIERARSFLVVKSIISSSCVVRTNISELIYTERPEKVFVLAPVILKGAQERLRSDFADEIARRFEYVWFAEDDERKSNGEVVPGIGGSVYELLGIGTSATKNQFIPDLVKERRQKLPT